MINYTVNGIERPIGLAANASLKEFFDFVYKSYNSGTSIVSSIIVDGIEIREQEEDVLSTVLVRDIGSLEVLTQHPREFADHTLQSMGEFSHHLESQSRLVAAAISQGTAHEADFLKLIEGIQIFASSLVEVKKLLRIGTLPVMTVLEIDMLNILKDLHEFQKANEKAFLVDLLVNHLPMNLAEWREKAIPAMVRSRDS